MDTNNEWPEICGCTISVRQSEDIITVWNKIEGDARMKDRIRYDLSSRLVSFSWLSRKY